MEDQVKEALQKSSLGIDSYSPLLGKLWWYGELVELGPGTVLIRQGDSYDGKFYLVIEGELRVEKDGQFVRVLSSGAICGETGLYGTLRKGTPYQRIASVTAVGERTIVLRFGDSVESSLSPDEKDELLRRVESKVTDLAVDGFHSGT